MPLALGAEPGDIFLIGRRQLQVVSIGGSAQITLRRDDGQTFTVRRDMATEVFPDVFIYTGPWQRASRARLVFDAPQTILIRRGGHADLRSWPAQFREAARPPRRSL